MCILKEYQDNGYNITFLTPKKSLKGISFIEEVAGIKINKVLQYGEHYNAMAFEPYPIYDTWLEYLENERIFDEDFQVDEIVIFGSIISDAGNLTREKNLLRRILHTRNQMNFAANGSYIMGMFQLIKLSRNNKIPVHEICFDPCENSISQMVDYKPYKLYCYHGYDWPDYNLIRLDSLQHYLNREKIGLANFFEEVDVEKDLDVCFGFTALTSHRERQYDNVMEGLNKSQEVRNIVTKIFIRHKKLNIDTFVDRDTYLSNIKRARYTLIIPPYDLCHFSIYRFIESIYNNCLPLITSDVYVDDFVSSFGISRETINKITVDYSTIGNRINQISESEREDLLQYFKDICLVNDKKLKIGL
jgi:hypothetical protein